MINCYDLSRIFKKNDLTFFTGVPDSTFKDWMKFLADKNGLTNIIASNECEAIAIASGYNLATNKVGVVYMQNSGEGKAVNPLTSLCDKEVYSIPLIMMIGWRGEPDKPDEPQHKKMGRVMLPLLNVLEIPYKILSENVEEADKTITEMKNLAIENSAPVALIIKKETLEKYETKNIVQSNYEMNREEAIKEIVNSFDGSEIVVSTTGKCSRELFEIRITREEIPRDFYTVGSMGCSAAIAFGVALSKPKKEIYCFDGDGAAIMQMGTFATIGSNSPKNFRHILFDNNSYDSTGGQNTVSNYLNFEKIALACGYNYANTASNIVELNNELDKIKKIPGPTLTVIKVKKEARNDLGRPTTTPIQNKKAFMINLK